MNKITEYTLIPISLLITIIGLTVSLTLISAKADQAVAENVKQEQKIDSQMTILLEIREKLIRIEERRK